FGVLVLPVWLVATSQGQGPPPPEKKGPGFGFKVMGPGGPQVRKLVKQFDKDGDGRLNREERQAAREFLKKERKGGGPGGFGPGGVKVVFGPGNFLAKPLLEALDTDKDGKLSKEELLAGVKTFFSDTDKDKKGALTRAQLAAGLNRILPQPGGPPGGP